MSPSFVWGKKFDDHRGFFCEAWAGDINFRQINRVVSKRGVLRGMHYQEPAQTKLVFVTKGLILDVIINLETKEVHRYTMSENEISVLLVPKGYAHGYQVLSDEAHVCYAVDEPYSPTGEKTIPWDSFGFPWPLTPILSDKDSHRKVSESSGGLLGEGMPVVANNRAVCSEEMSA